MVVVDTHIVIWNALKPDMLSRTAQDAINHANEADGLAICEISLWEIAMLIEKKRIQIPVPYLEFINLIKASNKYTFHGITPEIVEQSVQFPPEMNADPADRIIVATSLFLNSPLITADKNLRENPQVLTIW